MALLLGGGGDPRDERPVLDRFVELSGSGPIAYWPVALDLGDYSAATAFAEAALGRPVDTWARLDEHSAKDLRSCGGVFIGGGNTYRLLNEVRRSGMADALRTFATAGALYGGSAGAILFGADIGPAAYLDQDEVGITDTSGLGLLGDYTVWCHFEHQQMGRLNDWVRSSGHPVIALTERSGAEVTGNTLSSIGRGSVYIVESDGSVGEIVPGRGHTLT